MFVYSDTQTYAQGPALLIPGPASYVNFLHSAWTVNLSPAKWISDAPDTLTRPADETTRYFTRFINIPCTPSSIVAKIAADNSFWTYVNGQSIQNCFDSSEYNFNKITTCNLTPFFNQGDNVIEWKVLNWRQTNGSYKTNPSGLIYSIEINY